MRSNEQRISELENIVRELIIDSKRASQARKPAKVKPKLGASVSNLIFLDDAVTVNSAGGSSVAWTTYNAIDYIPADTSEVILDVLAENDAAGGELRFQARRTDGDIELEWASVQGMSEKCAGQIVCGVYMAADQRSFDYKITSPGGSAAWTVRLIAYRKRLRVFGGDWLDGSTGVEGDDTSFSSGGSSGKRPPTTGGLS